MATSIRSITEEHKLPPLWDKFLADIDIVDGTDGSAFITYRAHEAAVGATQSSPAKPEIPEDYSCRSTKLNATFAASANTSEFNSAQITLEDGFMLGLQPGADVEVGAISDVFRLYSIDLADSALLAGITDEISKLTKVKLVHGDGLRNGLWMLAGEEESFELTTLLTYRLSTNFTEALAKVADLIGTDYGIDLSKAANAIDAAADQSSITFKIQHTTTGTNISHDPAVANIVISQTYRAIFSIKLKGFIFNLEFNPEGVQVDIREDTSVPGDVFAKLGALTSSNTADNAAPSAAVAKPDIDDTFLEVHLWSVALGKVFGGGIWWTISFAVKWKAESQDVWLGLSYDTRTQAFSGELLFSHMFPSGEDLLLPYWSPLELPPVPELPASFDLQQLFSEAFKTNADSLPAGIPTQITRASLTFSKLTKEIRLAATIESAAAETESQVPAPFTWNEISVEVRKAPRIFEAHVFSSFTLNPLPEDRERFQPAQLAVQIEYDSGSWQLQGLITDFQLGVLATYADADCSSAFIAVLGKLTVRKLFLNYAYSKREASSFLFTGTILLGKLQLDLTYQFVAALPATGTAPKTAAQLAIDKAESGSRPLGKAKPLVPAKEKAWRFEAYLGSSVADADLGTIAESIVDGAADVLPSFVRDIKIGASSDPDTAPISLRVEKPKGSKDSVVFTLNIEVEGISLTFVQISDNAGRKATPPVPPKQALRISVAKIPLVKDIPIVQDFPQPFEKLQYVWVNEKGSAWSTTDIAAANSVLAESDKLYYKETNKSSAGDGPKLTATDDIAVDQKEASGVVAPLARPALAVGHHFIIIDGGKVILDHVFRNAKSRPKPSASDPARPSPPGQATRSGVDTAQPEPAPTKAALSTGTKLLSIEAVALQFKEGYLWINIDATVTLGPIGMSLLGFGIGLPLADPKVKLTLNDFGNVTTFLDHVKIRLNGMGVSFEKPPLLLAGVFEHEVSAFGTATKDSYRGGIGISFPPYTFVAVGEYSQVQFADREYKSVFIYAKLDGPLVTLEFATISGVRIGFGYNSSIRQPASIEEVTNFPLINDHGAGGAGNSPIKLLRQLTSGGESAWVTPKEDAYWFAVGMTISSFDILSITACAIFAFKDRGIVIDLYANAIAQMPPGVPATDTDKMILYCEIDMHACMNFVDGYFLCEAALAPTSFLLVPQCHLYGGFALCYWFGNNPHAGDWVFSVGGYHRRFQRPDHYPDPRRLGISFVIGDNIQMRGEGYFAITPKAVMGGAMIHISLDVGPVSAYLDASFDALINFHPIHYMIDVHVAVGVSCNIDIGLIHIHISISIGADLHIEGPEFGGVAHVDFWFFGFDVYFGSHGGAPPPLSLDEFWEQVHKAGPVGGNIPEGDKTAETLDVELKHNLETGNFPMPEKDSKDTSTSAMPEGAGAGVKWFVKGGSFAFRVSADFALSKALVANEASDDSKTHGESDAVYTGKADAVTEGKSDKSVFSVPMHINAKNQPGGIESTLYVTIYQKQKGGGKEVISGWKARYICKDVPSALWAEYNKDTDPMRRGADTSQLLKPDGPTISLPMGITLAAPDPVLAVSKIPAFNATEMAKAQVMQKDGSDWLVPTATLSDASSVANFPPASLTGPEKDPSGAKRWDAVKSAWRDSAKSGASIASSMAALCGSSLGWDRPTQGDVQRSADSWQLKTALPSRLVVGTGTTANADVVDGLENYYMTLPRLGVVGA